MSFQNWEKSILSEFGKVIPDFFDSNKEEEWVVVGKYWDCSFNFDQEDLDGCIENAELEAKSTLIDLSIDLQDADISHKIRDTTLKGEGIVQLDVLIEGMNRPNPKTVVDILTHRL